MDLEHVLRQIEPTNATVISISFMLRHTHSVAVEGIDIHPIKLKSRYGGMEVSEAARLKALGDENAKLKHLLADTMLDNVVLKVPVGKELTTLIQRREAALRAMRDHHISQR